MSILDVLFPKHCICCRKFGSYICSNCFTKIQFCEINVCLKCQRPAFGGLTHPVCLSPHIIDGVFSSLIYAGVVKKLVYRFKYAPYLRDLESSLVSLFYEGLIQKESFYTALRTRPVLVPIPLHASRLRRRGYNQSHLLAEGLGKQFSLPVIPLLSRVRKTTTQIGKTGEERATNMQGAFAFRQDASFVPLSVLLVDDVTTSGATLLEAAKMLKRAGVKRVWGITLAHGL